MSVFSRSVNTVRCSCGSAVVTRSARNAASKRSATTSAATRPTTLKGLDNAYDFAQYILEGERRAVEVRIKELEKEMESAKAAGGEQLHTTKEKLDGARLAVALSKPEHHYAFRTEDVDLAQEPYASMHHLRWQKFNNPRLIKELYKAEIIGDVLAEYQEPTVNVEVKFPGRHWRGLFGQQSLSDNTAYSPEVVITTRSDEVRYFTLMMIDVDRPNLDSKSYDQWVHWMITDIPVQNRLIIPGGTSPFLGPPTAPSGPTVFTTFPEQPPELPGNVIFPYVPPHPALQAPKKIHRYMVVALEQKGEKLPLGMDQIRAAVAEEEARLEAEAKEAGKPWDNKWMGEVEKEVLKRGAFVGEAEKKIGLKERAVLLPLAKFMEEYNLSLQGYGFFQQTYTLRTPEIFTRLGLHEPVYGKLRYNPRFRNGPEQNDIPKLIRRIDTATQLASALPAPAATLSSHALRHLNEVRVPLKPIPSLPSERLLAVTEAREKDRLEAAQRALKNKQLEWDKVMYKGRELKFLKEKKKAERSERAERQKGLDGTDAGYAFSERASRHRMPRVSLLAAVGLVKSKEGDVAKEYKGDVWKGVREMRYRYLNV
ncbi:MFT2-Corn MFT-like protein [Rhizophlyctis rosea]|nr:MFT2-Corn MFT-like protein [Rhizophlyctis rosea]